MLSDKEIVCPNNLLDVAHQKKGVSAGIVNAGKSITMMSVMDSVNENLITPIFIGNNSRIGTNAVVLKNVPENHTFVGIPARKVESLKQKESFEAYGVSEGKIDDPNKKSILAMFNELHLLNEKINLIESKISSVPFRNEKMQTEKKIKKNKNK